MSLRNEEVGPLAPCERKSERRCVHGHFYRRQWNCDRSSSRLLRLRRWGRLVLCGRYGRRLLVGRLRLHGLFLLLEVLAPECELQSLNLRRSTIVVQWKCDWLEMRVRHLELVEVDLKCRSRVGLGMSGKVPCYDPLVRHCDRSLPPTG